MSCYHPLHAFDVGVRSVKTDKPLYKIESGNVDWVRDEHGVKHYKYIEIPCGKCIGCRLDYSRQWAVRCMLESEYHQHNYFLTLTYDDLHLPMVKGCDDEGVIMYRGTLVPKHLADFLKRLRIYFKRHYDVDDIKFFACGEYGEKYERPHYHLIVFGLPIPDLQYFKTSIKTSEIVYRSPTLEKLWPFGFVGIGKVSFESCAYVARYVVKKRKGKGAADWYALRNIEPEFVRMSRRPGIALQYFLDHKKNIYDCDEIILSRKNGPQKVKPCRYYDSKFDLEAPDLLVAIKENRQSCAKEALKQKLERTSLSKDEYMKLCENNKEQSAKKLLRKMY